MPDLPDVPIIGDTGGFLWENAGFLWENAGKLRENGLGKCPNVSHHPTIGDIYSNGYGKVM